MYRYLYVFWLAAFSCSGMLAWGGEADTISSRILHQLQVFPQEKVFVHTDRPRYGAGDTIWLRAHLVDAATHIPTSVSRYVYVELVDGSDSIVNRIKLRDENEIYRGQIALDSMLAQGYYTLRAYTDFMENLPEDYLFKQVVPISGSYLNKTVGERKGLVDGSEFDVSFFPEGGSLPTDVLWKVAFKAVGADGWHEQVSGRIVEKDTEKVVAELPVPHLGMGYVTFCPQAGKEYVAQCLDEHNRYHEFALPEPTPEAQSLMVLRRKEWLTVSMNRSVVTPRYLVLHVRGMVYYAEPWMPPQTPVRFDTRQLPSGVIQILLLDDQFRPLSERLVFNQGNDVAHTSLRVNALGHDAGETVKVDVRVSDDEMTSLQGNFSVSVTDNSTVRADQASSIYTHLLLTSELQGTIEFPETYFDTLRTEREEELDVLMMTQGWRRYDWTEVLQGHYREPEIKIALSQEISGRLLKEFKGTPRAGAPVAVFSPNQFYLAETVTDSAGYFRFSGFDFPDSTRYVVSGTNPKGRTHDVLLKLDEEKFYPFAPSRNWRALYEKRKTVNDLDVDTLDNRGLLSFRLDEVLVKAPAIPKRQSTWYNFPLASTYTYDYFERYHPHTMLDLLSHLPGVMRAGDHLLVHGKSPVYILDDSRVFDEFPLSISPDDVYQVVLVKDASTVILGTNIDAVIMITTKTGDLHKPFNKSNILPCNLLGYHCPAEFYSPKFVPASEKVLSYLKQRPTCYWNPAVSLSDEGTASFEFYVPNSLHDCTVLIQGVTSNGQIIYMKKEIGSDNK